MNEKIKQNISYYFKFYEKEVFPIIIENKGVTQKLYWEHWFFTHTDSVVFRWIDFALSINEDPIPVILACALHDTARIGDWDDIEHGKRALPIAKDVIRHFNDILDEKDFESICSAIGQHTVGRNAKNYISGCTRDADRVRLSRYYWFRPEFFFTQRAKDVASKTPREYLNFQNFCLDREMNEDREGVIYCK